MGNRNSRRPIEPRESLLAKESSPCSSEAIHATVQGATTDHDGLLRQLHQFFRVGSSWSGSVLFAGWDKELELDLAITDYDARSKTLLGYRVLFGSYEAITMKVFRGLGESPQVFVTIRDGSNTFLASDVNLAEGTLSGTVRGEDRRGYYSLQRMGDAPTEAVRTAQASDESHHSRVHMPCDDPRHSDPYLP